MRHSAAVLGLFVLVSIFATGSALARGSRGDRVRSSGGGPVSVGTPEAEDPVAWMTDYDEALKLGAEEKRPVMVLITTEELERSSSTCSFAANVLRKAVRGAKVVPVKLRPPVMLDTSGLSREEAAQRQETFKKARERYEQLAKAFGVQMVPSLVHLAPDGGRLAVQSTPADQEIMAVLGRLPEMVKAHEESLARAGAVKQPGPPAGGQVAVKDGEPRPAETKPAEPAPKPKSSVDDF
ncbi:MAG TPA: hypothetical protein PK280_16985 [Planctomycetota bacterium]|nr:hypothetical protein [Planctomycetota bacterium]